MSIHELCAAAAAFLQEPILHSSDNVSTLYSVKQLVVAVQKWKTAMEIADDDMIDPEAFLKANKGSPLETLVRSLRSHTLFDTRTGTRRPIEAEEVAHIISAPAEEVLGGFYQSFDVLSLQDIASDINAEHPDGPPASIQEMAKELEDGPLRECIVSLLMPTAKPTVTEGTTEVSVTEGTKPQVTPVFGLLALFVLEDLLSGDLQEGRSIFNPQYSSVLTEEFLRAPFNLETMGEGLPAFLKTLSNELAIGEITL